MLNQFEIPQPDIRLVLGLTLFGVGCYFAGVMVGRREGMLHAYSHLDSVAQSVIQQIWQQPGRQARNG